MELYPEESSDILSLVYSKARTNGKILKLSLRRKSWEKHTEQDIAIWTDVPGPFQLELQMPPTLVHLFSNRAHSKIPPIMNCDGHIPLNWCMGFLGSLWATKTGAEINFVTRESISFHFPGKKFHENQSSHRKFLILGKKPFSDRELPQLKNIWAAVVTRRVTFHSCMHWEGLCMKASSTVLEEVVKLRASSSQELLIIRSSDCFDHTPKLELGGLERC